MIRFSTSQIYQIAINGILEQQSRINSDYQQLSSGRKINRPSDAPAAAARVIGLNTALDRFSGWTQNANNAQQSLEYESTRLQSVTTLVNRVRTLALQMANGTLSIQDRRNGAAIVRSYLDQLIGYANAQGPGGQYVFAGSRTNAQPFALNNSGTQVNYHGDGGQRSLPISSGESIPVTDPGSTLFMNIPDGNGTFRIQTGNANTGTATAAGNVTDPAQAATYLQANGDSYQIRFSSGSGGLTYTVMRGPGAVGSAGWNGGATQVAGGSFSAGATLNFDGLAIGFSGNPAAGDTFDVNPSRGQSLFKTLLNLHTALISAAASPAQNARNMQAINTVLESLDQSQTRFGSVQAAVGTRIQAARTAAQVNQSVQTQFKQIRSGLEDANLPQVITRLDQASLSLQAASKAFVQMQGLSLFKYLP